MNGHQGNPAGASQRDILEGAVDPTGEYILTLIPTLVFVAALKSLLAVLGA